MKLAPLVLLLVPATAVARPEPDKALTYSIAVDGYASDGPVDAKVTLVMAQDYADPFSQRSRNTLEELRKKYGNDLRIVFRNMVVHPRNAMASALASCAALKQKAFDTMEEKLWGQFGQRQWDLSDIDLGNGPQKCWDTVEGCKNVVGFATEAGLKVDRFKADMRACVQTVEDDMTDLKKFAVQATPTFFINGRHLAGAQPTQNFETIVDEELAKANERIKKGTAKARYYRTWVVDKGEKKVDQTAQPTPVPAPPPVGIRPSRPEPDRALTYAIPVAGYPTQGPADALVTLVIAHDYADPYSNKNRDTLAELAKKYGRDLRIVYRNLVVHPRNAMAGALASCAAHRQTKFEPMETKLWEAFAQRSLDLTDVDQGNGPQKCYDMPEGCPIVVGFAKSLGLDVNRFKADMKGACVKIVADDMRELQTFALGATPSFFINGRYLSGAQPTASFEALIDEELAKATAAVKKGVARARFYQTIVLGKGQKQVTLNTPPTGGAPSPRRPEPDRTKNYAVKVDGYPSKGPADAKVTIVMFFDYATPYAERARATLDELMQRYGNELRIVYRTRLVHPTNAHAAALALCAAHKTGKAVAMDEALWEKAFKARNFDQTTDANQQKCWDAPEGCKAAVAIAQDLGHDPKRFKADMKSCVATVEADDKDASTNFWVTGTPTFFINGRWLVGAQPVENFAQLVDEELAKATDRIKKGTPKARYYKTWIVDKGDKQVAP
jgi:protein-disulfide isomerase